MLYVLHFVVGKGLNQWSVLLIYFVVICSERRARARGSHGEWKTEKDPQAEDDLLQLPARCSAEALPEGAVPRSARESGACGSAWPDSDTGKLPDLV